MAVSPNTVARLSPGAVRRHGPFVMAAARIESARVAWKA
jgi:hypothetical protein